MNPPRSIDSPLIVVTTTCASHEDARRIARQVIAERLAACVQIDGPIESHYLWDEQTHCDTEWRLTMKTTRAALGQLEHRVREHHPYELPQWVVFSADAAADYLAWLETSLKPAAPNPADLTRFHVQIVPKGAEHLGTTFDAVVQMIQNQSNSYFEHDGSFAWTDAHWQLYGMIYDAGEFIRYIELRGNCPLTVWQSLVRVGVADASVAAVLQLPLGDLYDLQSFETRNWPRSA